MLRYSFRIAESSFDPTQITDLYSRTIVASIFEAPLEYEFLARPARMRTNTAAAMPEVSADFKTFTFRIQPGVHFADDPAFKGAKRELIAQDYVYSIKRHFDPRWKSGNLYLLENFRILGLSELRKELIDAKKPFDYDRDVEGLRALDRYTFQIKTAVPNPRLLQQFTDASFMGALAREVVEFYGDRIGDHPVGTGPFRITEWRRSSRIVLERNANYREVFYDERPAATDARLQAVASGFQGKRLPLVDRVEISIVEENQPRWLAFLNGEHDVLEEVPPEFISIATPNGKLAPNLAKQGMQAVRYPRAEVSVSYFAMENPVVGGYEPHKVALRRAMSLAVDVDKEIIVARRGQAIPAQSPIGPETFGYDPKFKSEMSEYNLARAKALLDLPRLRGQKRRRLARATRRLAAAGRVRQPARPAEPRVDRPVEDEHGRAGRAHGIQNRQVAGEPEEFACRQADDVGRGLEHDAARWRHLSRAGLRPEQGRCQPRALQSAGLQCVVRAATRVARRPGAPGTDERREEADDRLHALQGARAPHLDRPGAALGQGLPPQHRGARVLEVRRCGCAAASRTQRQLPLKMMNRHVFRLLCAAALALSLNPFALAQERKILNVAFLNAETTIDPSKSSDLYSRAITAHIFEALYTYDHLARPATPKPLIADGMPTPSADFRTWTVKIKPGIYFQDDPVFKGRKREVTAQDFIYTFQRIADPANPSALWSWIESYALLGLAEQRKAALDGRKPFDYDAPIEGLQALDRYTIQYKLKDPRPRLITGILTGSDLTGAQAREVVEFYGDKIDEHPVGTGRSA